MRFFLATIVDLNTKAYVRDLVQKLTKYKRNFEFTANDLLHFNYKYLGKDLNDLTASQLGSSIADTIRKLHLVSFTYPLLKPSFGANSELNTDTLTMRLDPTKELNELYRLVQAITVEVQDDKLVRRKDHNRLLGVIKIGQITTNISSGDRDKVESIINQIVSIPTLTVDNLSIIGSELVRNKVKLKLIRRIDLKDD